MLSCKQLEQRIGRKRTCIDDAGSDMQNSQFDSELEHMREWQDRESAIGGMDGNDLYSSLYVRDDIAMRQHDTFGLAGGARGKDQLGQILLAYSRKLL